MNEREEKARALFLEGYNCSQAVMGAFCEDVGMDFETAMRLTSSFGGGMGRMREVCGAVSALFMIAGLLEGYTAPDDTKGKTEHYARIQALAEAFREKHGTILCRELLKRTAEGPKPEARTDAYYKERPCAAFVGEAARLAAEIVKGAKK